MGSAPTAQQSWPPLIFYNFESRSFGILILSFYVKDYRLKLSKANLNDAFKGAFSGIEMN